MFISPPSDLMKPFPPMDLTSGGRMAVVWQLLLSGLLLNFYTVHDCSATCLDSNHDSIFIECGPGQVIYAPNITAGTGSCDAMTCNGLSTNMFVFINNECFWHQNCSLPFPKNEHLPILPIPIIPPYNGDIEQCLSPKPKWVKVFGWKCLPGKTIVDICKNHEEKIRNTGSGIIRSQPKYPWHYDKDMLFKPCVITIEGNDTHDVQLTVDSIEIADETDQVKIIEDNKPTTMRNNERYHSTLARNITVEFMSSNSEESKEGRGFVMCYTLLPKGQSKSPDVCADMTETRNQLRAGQCGPPPTVKNATVQKGSNEVGSVRTYCCDCASRRPKKSSITCQESGRWTEPDFKCTTKPGKKCKKRCPRTCRKKKGKKCHVDIKSTDNVLGQCGTPPTVKTATVQKGSNEVGSVRTYCCDCASRRPKKSSITCQESGHWTEPDFKCTIKPGKKCKKRCPRKKKE